MEMIGAEGRECRRSQLSCLSTRVPGSPDSGLLNPYRRTVLVVVLVVVVVAVSGVGQKVTGNEESTLGRR